MSRNNDTNIKIFHVRLPFNTESYKLSVLGNCDALGNWKEDKIQLRQIRNTIWKSDPVHIPVDSNIKYKYYFKKDQPLNEDSFIDYIYETIESPDSLNCGFLDYQYILRNYREEFKNIINFIKQCLFTSKPKKTKEQVLFLCVLLGDNIEYRPFKSSLPYNFPSSIMLKEFKSIDDCYGLPSNAKTMIERAIKALIQHNSKGGFLDWIIIFALAAKLDMPYSFIDSIEIYDYEKQPNHFVKLLKEIKPSINDLKNSNSKASNKTIIKLVKISYNAECLVHLQEYFKDLGSDYYIKYEVRKKLLELLKDIKLHWNKENISSIHRLLMEPNLGWQNKDYISVLKAIAGSSQTLILESFPEIFKFISGLDLEEIKKDFERESITWFIKIYKKYKTYDIFHYLSMMHTTSKYGREILNKLLNHNIMTSLSDDSLFSITSSIEDFHEDIIVHFISLVKERVGLLVQVPNERLLEKTKQICGSTTSLNIRNRSCEEILCFILDRLQQAKDVKFSEIESFQLSMFQFAKFWMTIFKAEGHTEKLCSHPYFKEACETVIHIATSIKDRTITIRLLQKIFKYFFIKSNRVLRDYLNSAMKNYPGEYNIIPCEVIEESYSRCYEYILILERLQKFYKQFCPSQLVTDVKQYLDNLEKRSIDATLEETYIEDHWSMHSMTIEIMKNHYHLIESQTFYNAFQIVLKEELTVKQVMNEIIKEVIENYKTICEEYDKWEEVKCSVANEFWKNVDIKHVEKEIEFMSPYVEKLKSSSNTGNNENNIQKLIGSVKLLVDISPALERLYQLQNVIKGLGVIQCDQDSWIEELIKNLEDEELLLYQLYKIFYRLNEIEKKSSLTNDVWSIITEISSAIDFVIFLKSLVGHNLKNLINGVDDHSDERLIQENTVQTFIQVKQILEPLLEERKGNYKQSAEQELQKFLLNLHGIIKKNSSLVFKLRLCNANAQALMNMYKNISNRGEITKEKIFYSVTKGVYSFERMKDDDSRYTATLSYSSDILRDGTAKYTFADLQDLRGRALLIAKAPTNAKAFINEKTLDNESIKASEITLDHMNQFVIRVDLAQEIIDTASSLKELGHFKYRDFQISTRSTQDMERLLKTLQDDLQNWEKIVNEAQKNHYYLTFFLAQHILNFYDYFSCSENIATTRSDIKEKCSILLRYVNDKAELPNIESDNLNISLEPKNYYRILCKIGTILHGIFSQIPTMKRQMTAIVNHETVNEVRQGHLFIAKCNNKFRVPNIIMSLCNLHNKCYPEAWQLLICKSSTTEEELLTFTKRCFYAAKNGYGEHLLFIANVEFLDFELQYQLVSSIRSLCQQDNQFYLVLICCLENSMHHHILDQFSEHTHVIQGIDANSMHNIYKELCPNVMAVSSDLSGQGKTKWIEEQSFTHELVPRKFLISDGMTFGILVHKLSEIRLKDTESLHLNITLIDHHYDINMFLFEFLSLKIVRDRTDFLSISPMQIYIEIESSMNQDLLNAIPIIGHLEKMHLTWNINNTIIPQDVNSPIQIVASYLDAYDRNTINSIDIALNTDREELISESSCRQLLQKYFFDKITQEIKTYRFLEIFVNVLADQLRRMSSSAFFRVEILKLMEADKNIRMTLLETLIEVSMEFATRSVNLKKDQLKNLSEKNNKEISITNIKHWEDSNHLLVFFLSQSPDSICALYRDRNKVPKNVENLLRSQHFPANSNFVLDNYDNMSCEDILKKLECLARTTHDEREYAPYALSADNLLKMALILLRSRANVPVVICGEAGCGKTSLIQFLSGVVNVKFKILNLHAGVTKEQILEFLFDAEVAAEEGEIWLFFDEINTCNHIGIIADLIAHRLLLGKEIHKNIRLFAACNPYRFRQKADTQAGLLTDRYEEKNSLVYQVRPLPDQILDYVWDYGVLKPSNEKIYINIMIKKSQENLQEVDLFTELLFASQEFVRAHEGVHSVSLRDVKRAIIIFKFFCKSFDERQKIAEKISEQNVRSKFMRIASDIKSYFEGGPNNVIKSYILALSLCYQVRFFDQELRYRYQERMCEIFEENGVEIDYKTFMEVVQGEQKDFMKRMTKPSMVAENFALLENVLAITVCILTRIPLFIIGAPGASKSLAIRLVSQSLRGNDSDDPYFRTLPQVYVVPHQGSSSSTSDGISTVFDKANNYQKGNSEEFPLITVVLLDEIGLAEKSPHNPLKVLHSLLEPNYPAELPEVAVIGISNWRLDNSKSSRALLVQRPNLESKDLIETTRLLLGKGTESQFKALADSYLEYKIVQPINNFHGLRDYYFLVKSLSGGESAQMALARNFGGTNRIDELYRVHFDKIMTEFHVNKIDDEDNSENNITAFTFWEPIIMNTNIIEEIKFDELDKEFNFDNYLLKRQSDIMINQFCDIIDSIWKKDDNINKDDDDLDSELDKNNSTSDKDFDKNNSAKDDDDLDSKLDKNKKKQDNDKQHSSACNENNSDDIQIKLQLWQRCVANILSIACNLSNSFDNPSLNVLRVYNDLSKSIPLTQMLQIRQHETDLFSAQSINIIFKMFDQVAKTEISLFSKRSFIYRCLNIIPLESPTRSHLYVKIFSQEPLPFTFHIIYLIFESENRAQEELLFFNIINNPGILKSTKRLQVIENILSNQTNSEMAALCCDSLYLKGLTTYEIKRFCEAQQQILPWVRVLKTDCDNRLGFNPYWYLGQFKQVDLLVNTISYSDEISVSNLFNSFIGNNEITRKISLAGMIITKFYLIRASRELNTNENLLIQKISKYLHSSQLPENYKTYLSNFMTNSHQLYKLTPNIENIEVFISSVVAHVVALNISISVNSSPLAAYMQALYDHKDTYILTCPSDEFASITNVMIAKDSGTRRYQCKCGLPYFIGDCGRPDQIGECNQCKNKIGGLGHNLNEGSSSIDNDKLKQSVVANDKQGYIIEDVFDTYHTVRNLHLASYRILHLFLHIIIGVQAHLPTTVAFINNQEIDIVQYCKKHIENDWKTLKNIFNCEDETFRSMTILEEIKNLIHQEPIPANSRPLISDNQIELLSALEIIICFLKQTSGDQNTLISDYIEKWIKLSYQANLNESLKQDIIKSIDFEKSIFEKSAEIPAKAFLTALKRLIVRYLSTDNEIIKENDLLSLYLLENESLGCWPDYVSIDIIEDKFPTTLLTSHIYNAYKFIEEKQRAFDQKNQTASNQNEQYIHLNKRSKRGARYGRFRKS
ncbi:10695_t:CDS:10 [Dentiscutata erythropus]|uniref:10695_t:CDS:1 n=1 Tax=Dentiscutata erythropus TaxID=1348616 RepID=A0A9N9A2J7_9GLOM|nr:10695_t:CDS:10 [Dentiscutata erythropus]